MSDSERRDESVFGEEDNNPFPHTSGLASLMQNGENGHKSENNIGTNGHAIDSGSASPENAQDEDDDDESLLLYRNDREQFNTIQINYESRVTKLLSPDSNARIHISEAGKSNEGLANSLKKYIVYTIKLINDNAKEEIQTRRRYSDFESLRDVLTRVFPLVIIPPIPPKNYFSLNVLNGLVGSNMSTNGAAPPANSAAAVNTESTSGNGLGTSYSYINSNHLNKNRLVEHRKRLLSNFLNNCLHITQIRNLEFFAKFLDPSANWSDEIALISSQLPKSVYQLNPENGLKSDALYAELPLPISNHAIKIPFLRPLKDNKKKLAQKTNQLLGSEAPAETPPSNSTNATEVDSTNYVVKTSHLDYINKKIMDNFIGLSNDYVELGTVMNSFSLMLADSLKVKIGKVSEDDEVKVDVIFDKIGLAFDRSYITINALIGELETKFSEPLGEAVQYSTILYSVNKFHERKERQKDLLDSEVKEKRKELAELMRAEVEASKIENAINSQVLQNNPKYDLNAPASKPSSKSNGKLKLFPSMNSLKKITKYVSDIIDQNPELTRKQKVVHLQTKITTLEKCQTIMLEDISYIADEMDKNFKSFHSKELKAIFQILLSYNGILVSWAKKNIEIWEEIKEEVHNL